MGRSDISYVAVSESCYFYYPSVRSSETIIDQLIDFRIGEKYELVEEWIEDEEQKSETIMSFDSDNSIIQTIRTPIKTREGLIKFTITFSDYTTEIIDGREFEIRFDTPAREWKWKPIENEYDNLHSSEFYDKWKMIKIERNVPKKTFKRRVEKPIILPILPDNPTKAEKRRHQERMRAYSKKMNLKKAEELL